MESDCEPDKESELIDQDKPYKKDTTRNENGLEEHENVSEDSLCDQTCIDVDEDPAVEDEIHLQIGSDTEEDEMGLSHEPVEMTTEEKQAMYESVISGDIDLLDDLMDEPAADINMIWFKENLLMAAIRAKQCEMAEFLLDNGVDCNFQTNIYEVRKRGTGLNCYTCSCRQMAYDQEMYDLVQVIDEYAGTCWKNIPRRKREIRMKKPLEEKLRERRELEEETGEQDGDQVDSDKEKSRCESEVGSKQLTTASSYDCLSTGDDKTRSVRFAFEDETEDTSLKDQPFPKKPLTLNQYYKSTKACLDRKQHNENHYTRSVDTLNRSNSFAGSSSGGNTTQIRAGQTHQGSRTMKRRPQKSQLLKDDAPPAATRYISPWKDDDPKYAKQIYNNRLHGDHWQNNPVSGRADVQRRGSVINYLSKSSTTDLPKLQVTRRSDGCIYESKRKPGSRVLTKLNSSMKDMKLDINWSLNTGNKPWKGRGSLEASNSESDFVNVPKRRQNLRICERAWSPIYTTPPKRDWRGCQLNNMRRQSPAGYIKTSRANNISKDVGRQLNYTLKCYSINT